MKKAIAVLSLCSALLPTLALADELDDLTSKLLKDSPLKCFDEVSATGSKQFRNALPDMMLEGVRNSAKLGEAWRPGNENYRQAHDLLEIALQDDEAKNGPIVVIDGQSLVRTAAASWTPAQRKEYLAFVKQKKGREYWEQMVDTKLCLPLIKSMSKPPYQLPPGAERDRMQKLELNANLAVQMWELGASIMPKEQRAKLEKQGPALQDSLNQASNALARSTIERTKLAAEPIAPELAKIIGAYKP